MRTVYIGTSAFSVAVLRELAASAHRPQLVVTRPDRPAGRGRRSAPPPIAQAARELGLTLVQPESVNEPAARELIGAARPQAVCVCAFGGLIAEPLLSSHSFLNVHPSLLPRWRGAAPIERAIMAGDRLTGVSIMRLDARLDSGPVCLAATEPIGERDTYGTLAERLAALGGRLLVRALDLQGAGALRCEPQDERLATHAPGIQPADRRLTGELDAVGSERLVRALAPHIGAFAIAPGGRRLIVWEARARGATAADPPPGEIATDGHLPLLGCAPGALELLVVQPEGRRAMPGDAYLRGLRGSAGARGT
ncbi:MAG TPA: methionyl-tRNA formyltransferase [Solirubrobacteraceae bacterium]|nr:methionyl-tRNA formyltransferase [Solirubrobacteraceae bacterium]